MPGAGTLEPEIQQAEIQPVSTQPGPTEFLQYSNQVIWSNWNQCITIQNTASCNLVIDNNALWGGWNTVYGSGSITVDVNGYVSNASVWSTWNQQYTVQIASGTCTSPFTSWAPTPETPEQKAAREEARRKQQAEDEARRKKEEEELNAARARARELLLRHLNEKQREEYETKKQFHVTSQEGNIYRIEYGWTRNVRKLDKDGRIVQNFCIHPAERIPEEDNLLAQKLMLECCEKEFVRIANKS